MRDLSHPVAGRCSATAALARRYPVPDPWRSDGAPYECVSELKARLLRHAPLLARVALDIRLAIDQRTLGTPTSVSRVQGGRLQAKREIRVAAHSSRTCQRRWSR